MFVASFATFLTSLVVDLSMNKVLILIWSTAVLVFIVVSFYDRKKRAEQQKQIEELIASRANKGKTSNKKRK